MATKALSQDPEPEPPTDRSYGMVTLRHAPPSSNPASASPSTTDNLQVLLIQQKTLNCGPPFWTFPKGHPEPGDTTLLDTARRELLEETGITVRKEDVLCFPSSSPSSSPSSEAMAKELKFEERYRIPYKPKPSNPPSNLPEDSQTTELHQSKEPQQPKDSQPTQPQEPQNSTFLEPYTSPNRTRGKIVTYHVALLSNSTSTALVIQEKEIAAAKWMSLDEAMLTIRFPEGKEVLRGVREAIEKAGGVEGCGRMSKIGEWQG